MEGAPASAAIATASAAVASATASASVAAAAAAIAAILAAASAARGAPAHSALSKRDAMSAVVCDAANGAVERQVLVVEELLWMLSVHGDFRRRRQRHEQRHEATNCRGGLGREQP